MLKNLSGFLTTATLAAALILEGNEHSIQQLQAVKNELTTKAASDFGGHQVAAIKSIDEAIHHLQEALAYDKK
ncbi:MAG: hypothetical protein DMG69_30225 [Acidobacteria bacterium]|nr:MAG: hypothetical protein DMG69_30225 [Acidobacteriota bacterium]